MKEAALQSGGTAADTSRTVKKICHVNSWALDQSTVHAWVPESFKSLTVASNKSFKLSQFAPLEQKYLSCPNEDEVDCIRSHIPES